jgi:hypothetical protein
MNLTRSPNSGPRDSVPRYASSWQAASQFGRQTKPRSFRSSLEERTGATRGAYSFPQQQANAGGSGGVAPGPAWRLVPKKSCNQILHSVAERPRGSHHR